MVRIIEQNVVIDKDHIITDDLTYTPEIVQLYQNSNDWYINLHDKHTIYYNNKLETIINE